MRDCEVARKVSLRTPSHAGQLSAHLDEGTGRELVKRFHVRRERDTASLGRKVSRRTGSTQVKPVLEVSDRFGESGFLRREGRRGERVGLLAADLLVGGPDLPKRKVIVSQLREQSMTTRMRAPA